MVERNVFSKRDRVRKLKMSLTTRRWWPKIYFEIRCFIIEKLTSSCLCSPSRFFFFLSSESLFRYKKIQGANESFLQLSINTWLKWFCLEIFYESVKYMANLMVPENWRDLVYLIISSLKCTMFPQFFFFKEMWQLVPIISSNQVYSL